MFSETMTDFVSVERLNNTINNDKDNFEEDLKYLETDQKLLNWPSKGEIKFKNIKMRYGKNLPLVLRNFSATIREREKIGICGRTGAGKSSLMQCIYFFS